MLVTMFGFGVVTSISYMVSYIYFIELMPSKFHTMATNAWMIGYSLINTVDVCYFWFISNHAWPLIVSAYVL